MSIKFWFFPKLVETNEKHDKINKNQQKKRDYTMDKFIKQLDPNLDYINHEINDGKCYITVASNRKEVTCPFCGQSSSRIHSTYNRTFQDLPIQGNKVFIIIRNRKMFCDNPDCSHTTFAERFDFISYKAKKPVVLRMKLYECQ